MNNTNSPVSLAEETRSRTGRPVSLAEETRSRTRRPVNHLGIYLEADEGNLSSPQLVAPLTLVVEVGFIQGSVSYSHVGLDEGNIRDFQGRAEDYS